MRIAERLLLRLSRSPDSPDYPSTGTARTLDGALRQLTDPFPDLTGIIAGRDVLDFGCGLGYQAVALALGGAARVVGVDISQPGLENGRTAAVEAGVADRVTFTDQLGRGMRAQFDVVISLNSMEHFSDPGGALRVMADALRPGGSLLITFSPPWYAPYGSHMYFFTRVPWVHLLFSERTVMTVRSRYRADGATRYADVEGGLNRMSVRKFGQLIRQTRLSTQFVRTSPVKGLRFLTHIPGVRELFTNRVTCRLGKAG
jgi:SAM-dependent methyltransferase